MRTLPILLVIALGLGLTACGDAGSDSKPVSKSDALGSYTVDKDHLASAMREMRMKELPNEGTLGDEARREAEAAIDDTIEEQMNKTSMTLVLKDDDTFVFTVTLGDNSEEASGPFTLDGSKITLTRTTVDGKEKTKVRKDDTVTGTIGDGYVDLMMDPEEAVSIRLRK